jgi:hypothetical protein
LATGLVTTARARPANTSATARRIDAIAAGALEASGCPGSAVTLSASRTTGSAPAKVRAASSGATARIATSRPSRRARRASASGSASR